MVWFWYFGGFWGGLCLVVDFVYLLALRGVYLSCCLLGLGFVVMFVWAIAFCLFGDVLMV